MLPETVEGGSVKNAVAEVAVEDVIVVLTGVTLLLHSHNMLLNNYANTSLYYKDADVMTCSSMSIIKNECFDNW